MHRSTGLQGYRAMMRQDLGVERKGAASGADEHQGRQSSLTSRARRQMQGMSTTPRSLLSLLDLMIVRTWTRNQQMRAGSREAWQQIAGRERERAEKSDN